MENLTKASRIVDAVLIVARGTSAFADFPVEGPLGEGIRDAVAEGFLITVGNGGVQLSEEGKRIGFEKDHCGYVFTFLNIKSFLRRTGREHEFIELRCP